MMTPKERAVMQQAIEFIVDCEYGKAELALREALAEQDKPLYRKVLREMLDAHEQAEQEPVAWYDREDSTNVLAEQPEQEPNTITFRNDVQNTWVMRITADQRIEVNEGIEVTEAAKLVLTALEPMLRYAAPVRTKDLTDDEIRFWIGRFPFLLNEESEKWVIGLARVIIAADREKNKCQPQS